MKEWALFILALLTIGKAIAIFLGKSTSNIYIFVLAGILIFWMTYAMFFNCDLSGPFGYKEGKNQVLRWINYVAFLCIFLMLICVL